MASDEAGCQKAAVGIARSAAHTSNIFEGAIVTGSLLCQLCDVAGYLVCLQTLINLARQDLLPLALARSVHWHTQAFRHT